MRNVFQNNDSSQQPIFSRQMRRRKRQKLSGLEPLEARQLLAGDIVVSEVLSSNDSLAQDEDGTHSDWIELYNTGATAQNLDGWYLTDDLRDRTQWRIPDVSLAPGESLVVYASGKNRDNPEGQLHTNFKLSRDGDYIGLYQADGRTVEYDFQLPQQYTDVSYGTGQTLADVTFVTPGDDAKLLVPTAAGQGLATETWTDVDFDDSSWTTGTNQIGFDDDAIDGDFNPLITNPLNTMRGNASSAYVRTTFNIDGEFVPTIEELRLDVNYDDGFVAFLNGNEVLNVSGPTDGLAWNSAATESHGGIADAFGYEDFANAAGDFTLLGNASLGDGVIRVTPSAADQNGAVWKTNAVKFGPDYTFSTSMTFDIHTPGGGLAGGDSDGIGGEGMTFVLQGNDNNVLGTGGPSLGLENTGSTFLAIELDSMAEGAFDPDSLLPSHIGVNTSADGSIARQAVPRFNGNAIFPGTPGPGSTGIRHLWVDYTGETQTLDVYFSTSNEKTSRPDINDNR